MWIHLHILHRIRRLGAITGVFGDESLGEQGRLANMLSDGKIPSPSVRLIVNVASVWSRAMGILTHHFLDRSFHIEHPYRFVPTSEFVGRLMKDLQLTHEAFVGPPR